MVVTMKRSEMIDILIEDRMAEWVYARNYDGLKEMLYMGFYGFEGYSNKELKRAIDDLDKEEVKKIKKNLKKQTKTQI